ncbi:hypothetical protein ACQE98_08705 [Ornithinimicrobium sp. W1679]|uniref:hypothetical protein n=1 Tax=Ornithinimicrobium sp. W1679 TaxID=3418770 RepID=UPI003CFAAD40
MTTPPWTGRWVASRRSAGEAAGALLRLTLRSPRWWLFVLVVELAFALLLGLTFDARYGTGTRVLWGTVYALVPTLGVASLGLGLAFLINRRAFGRRLHGGRVLESAFEEHALRLRGPWAETRLSFDGIASVRRSGDWVFLQQVGSPVASAWPAELFPPADLARLRRAVDGRSQASSAVPADDRRPADGAEEDEGVGRGG